MSSPSLEQGAPQREAIDRHFAVALTDLARCREPLVLETLELLMSEARAGSICLELGRRSGQARTEAEAWPDPESWARALHSSGLVGDGSLPTPLVLDAQGRLYLRRAWQDEAALARELSARSVLPPLPDHAALAARLERLFPPWSETGIDWQRAAAALAFASPTAVIAGGMRTGFLLDRFPDIDQETLQDPRNVAEVIRSILIQAPDTVVPEVMVLPMRETSWP